MEIPESLKTKRLVLNPYPKNHINKFLDSYKVSEAGFNLAILDKENNKYLGICGLITIRDTNTVRCVYAILPEFRGNGFDEIMV